MIGIGVSTRWSTTLSSKVNLPHAINFRASCGADLVTLHPVVGANPDEVGQHALAGRATVLVEGSSVEG